MLSFRVQKGSFLWEGKPVKEGDVVRSFRRLDEMFKNKFKLLDGESGLAVAATAASSGETPRPAASPPAKSTVAVGKSAGSPSKGKAP